MGCYCFDALGHRLGDRGVDSRLQRPPELDRTSTSRKRLDNGN